MYYVQYIYARVEICINFLCVLIYIHVASLVFFFPVHQIYEARIGTVSAEALFLDASMVCHDPQTGV